MMLTRRQIVLCAIARTTRIRKSEAAAALDLAVRSHEYALTESQSAEARLEKATQYAHGLIRRGQELDLSLYGFVARYVSNSMETAAQARTELEQADRNRQNASDEIRDVSLRLHSLEHLENEEARQLFSKQHASSLKMLDELVVVRHQQRQ